MHHESKRRSAPMSLTAVAAFPRVTQCYRRASIGQSAATKCYRSASVGQIAATQCYSRASIGRLQLRSATGEKL